MDLADFRTLVWGFRTFLGFSGIGHISVPIFKFLGHREFFFTLFAVLGYFERRFFGLWLAIQGSRVRNTRCAQSIFEGTAALLGSKRCGNSVLEEQRQF